ncbi:hypothetical protein [Sulfuricurvum sp.]|uniref:hypothetical protein n=1 Tax=Sulfuricurvum sp. TaxID=2025608 RepID=UPI0026201800|nr:hypothetical protein [Sulfuricurvum sp.]MDD4950589.1 hypothetical protein [Sulfuricurvum sp.]
MNLKISRQHYHEASNVATYNHFSYQIELYKYGAHFQQEIERTLSIGASEKLSKNDFNIMKNIHSILWHEYTHFLDHSTTLWGIEYNIRTLNLYNTIYEKRSPEDIDNRYEVFCMNLAEKRLHDLIKKSDKKIDNSTTVGYRLNHDEALGVYVEYVLYDKARVIYDANRRPIGDPICQIPLSMLAIIEANAYAQEILFQRNIIDRCEDIDKTDELQKLNQQLENDVNNCEMSEYTIMIRHTLQVFPRLDNFKVLEIVSSVAKLVLNMPIFLFGKISRFYIQDVFKANEKFASFLIHDHARGSSRASFFLMFIQWLASGHEESIDFDIDLELAKLLRIITNDESAPEFVEKMYTLDLETLLEHLKSINYHNPLKAIGDNNTKKAHLYKSFKFDFKKLLLPSFTLKDSTTITMPNPLKFDYNEYCMEIYKEYDAVDELIKKGIKKRPNIAQLGGDMFRDYQLHLEAERKKYSASKLPRSLRRKAERNELKKLKKH